MIVNANISIGRASTGEIRIVIQDNDSRTTLARVEMDAVRFTDALFGLAYVDVKCETGHLDRIGKVKVVERRQATYRTESYDTKAHQRWLQKNCQEDGWILDAHLGSQNSVSYRDGFVILNYHVIKFVDKEPT